MRILSTKDYAAHAPRFEYYDGVQTEYAEKPERITQIIAACRDAGWRVEEVTDLPENGMNTLHDLKYINYIREKSAGVAGGGQLMPSVFIADTYTPLTSGTFLAAAEAAGLAQYAAQSLATNPHTPIYALCRPPGHHAEHASMEGYCYFNNAAIAANELAKDGHKAAILDIDFHHGNGTQSLFYDRADVLYVSLHADPATNFPYHSGFTDETGSGTGTSFTRNFPLSKDTDIEAYLKTLHEAAAVTTQFKPDYLIVSLGFDTFADDPIAGFNIQAADYRQLGSTIAAQLPYPTLIVQEGGYNVGMLGTLAVNFLHGFTDQT